MPGGFVVGVHAEADPDVFGVRFSLFTSKALGYTDVAMGHEGVYLIRREVFEGFVLEEGLHGGGGGLAIDDGGWVRGLTSEK